MKSAYLFLLTPFAIAVSGCIPEKVPTPSKPTDPYNIKSYSEDKSNNSSLEGTWILAKKEILTDTYTSEEPDGTHEYTTYRSTAHACQIIEILAEDEYSICQDTYYRSGNTLTSDDGYTRIDILSNTKMTVASDQNLSGDYVITPAVKIGPRHMQLGSFSLYGSNSAITDTQTIVEFAKVSARVQSSIKGIAQPDYIQEDMTVVSAEGYLVSSQQGYNDGVTTLIEFFAHTSTYPNIEEYSTLVFNYSSNKAGNIAINFNGQDASGTELNFNGTIQISF